jgi:hypothetical protein
MICPDCGNEFAGPFHCGQCGWSEPIIEIALCPRCGDYLFNGQHRGNVEGWCEADVEGDALKEERP